MAYDITKLHPEVQELAARLVEDCRAQGLLIKITECVRTKEEQDAIYAQGRTTPGSIISNAPYPTSNHCWGIAFDFCRNDGRGAYNTSSDFFQRVGQIGKGLGLYWGGDFTNIVDMPHFETHKFGVWADLQAKYGTPDAWFASWAAHGQEPDAAPEKPAEGVSEYVRALQVSLNDEGCRDDDGRMLITDGIMGTRTQYAMRQVHLRSFCQGAMAGWVQTYLNILQEARLTYDGRYGVATEKAVRVFQARRGLEVDGITGHDTLKEMIRLLNAGHRGDPDVPVREAHGAGYVNVRSGPGTDFEVLQEWPKLDNGNRFDVIGECRGGDGYQWYLILIADQHVGYVRADLTTTV